MREIGKMNNNKERERAESHRTKWQIANDYETQEVLFNEMHSTLFRTIYFTVKVKTTNGFLSKDTKAIFNAHVLSSRSIENFNN